MPTDPAVPFLIVAYTLGCAVLLLLVVPPAHAQPADGSAPSAPYQPLTGAERWGRFASDIRSPRFFVRSLTAGTVAHVRDEPSSWGGGAGGFAARMASSTGGSLVLVSTEHGLAALQRADLRYLPPDDGGFGRRLGHAFLGSVTLRTRRGMRPNFPLAGGILTSTVAQSYWETGQVQVDGLGRNLIVALVIETAGNLITAFQ